MARSVDFLAPVLATMTESEQLSPMATTSLASAQTITDYLRHLRTRRLSPKTVGSARSILHCLAVACGGRNLLDLSPTDLEAWQARRADELAARSLRTQSSYVQQYYRWALDGGLLAVDPSSRLVTPKVPRMLPRPITEGDLASAIDAADDLMAAVLCLAAFAGLRAAEIAGLDWSDIWLNVSEPTLRVVGKGSRERIVDLSPQLVRVLRRLPGSRGPVIRRRDGRPGRNTPNRISQAAGRHLKAHDISDTLHSLRHRAITVVCRIGGVRVAQEFAGHASTSTTGGYSAVAHRDLRPIVVQAGEIQAS